MEDAVTSPIARLVTLPGVAKTVIIGTYNTIFYTLVGILFTVLIDTYFGTTRKIYG